MTHPQIIFSARNPQPPDDRRRFQPVSWYLID
jgi:hypothetical protein